MAWRVPLEFVERACKAALAGPEGEVQEVLRSPEHYWQGRCFTLHLRPRVQLPLKRIWMSLGMDLALKGAEAGDVTGVTCSFQVWKATRREFVCKQLGNQGLQGEEGIGTPDILGVGMACKWEHFSEVLLGHGLVHPDGCLHVSATVTSVTWKSCLYLCECAPQDCILGYIHFMLWGFLLWLGGFLGHSA